MISYKEAQQIILSEARSFGTETIRLDDADGRVLAEDIFADRDYPPFNRSAMDGYAIRIEDWENGIREFNVQEVIFAGTKPNDLLISGAAFKIMTGAAVPLPANAVIRREDAHEMDNKVYFTLETIQKFQNTAQKGEDLKKGTVAIKSHTFCSPTIISTLATLGKSSLRVEKLPTVALFTTGNEVKPLDVDISDVEIRNSNYYLIRSLLASLKIKPIICQHLPDRKNELENNIKDALKYDIVIMSGGVSAGDADYVPEVLDNLGVEKLFHKIAIKPGKPFWCGKSNNSAMVFALPGNPFSTFVTFKLFIQAYLQKAFNLPALPVLKSNFKGQKLKKTTFDEFFPAKLANFGTQLEATSLNGSGDIRLGIDSEVLGIHPAEEDTLNEGQTVYYYKL